ncbi:MAG TPA: glycosyltransferase family 4 protein [Dongiaceae bacterium]|nr:glycosyltransferase family 4 protein [Dongiaceae bacterium]
MRVAYYSTTQMELGGGLEKYFIETARDLSELPDMQVDILTMDDAFNLKFGRMHNLYFFKGFDPKLLYREPLETIQKNLGKARYFKSATFAEVVRRFQDYDVIYSRNDITEAFFFKFVLKYHRLPPVIFGCHVPHVFPIAERLHARLHNLLYTSWLYTGMARGVTGFHVINNFTQGVLSRQFPGRRVAKIYYPFDFDAFAANVEKNPFPGKLAAGKFNIVWVGRLVEQKGVRDLVQLVARINQTHADQVAWNICGDGELRPLVEECRKQWPNVTWWGHVNNQQMAGVYRQGDLFITTAKWEGYPYNVLESQALGLPVVAYDIAGCNDMIKPGVNGFVVQNLDEFAEKIRFFLKGLKLPPEAATYLRKEIDRSKIFGELRALFEACQRDRKG